MDDANNAHISIKDALKDEKRIKYHSDHLMDLLAAIKYVNPSVYIYIYIYIYIYYVGTYSRSHVGMIRYANLL
jgi:hypothetical protein